jgi:hypothetical protein
MKVTRVLASFVSGYRLYRLKILNLMMYSLFIFVAGSINCAADEPVSLSPAAEQSDVRLLKESQSALAVGHGYDVASEQSFDECVTGTFDPDVSTNQNPGLSGLFATSYIVETKKELVDRMTNGAALSIYGYGVSAASVSNLEISDYNLNALIVFNVEKSSRILTGVQLNTAARDLAISNIKRFREVCGSHFIVSDFTGGYLYAIITISVKNQADKDELKHSVGGIYNNIKFNAELGDQLGKSLQNREIYAIVFQGGGSKIFDGTSDVAAFIQAVNNASNDIIAHPTSQAFIARPYRKLIGWPPQVSIPQIAEQEIKNRTIILDYWYKLDDQRSRLNFLLLHQEEFDKFDVRKAQEVAESVALEYNNISVKLAACVRNTSKCKAIAPKSLTFDFPKRTGNRYQSCQLKSDVACGVLRYNGFRSAACGVEHYIRRRDEKCGVESYVMRRDAACGVETYNSGLCAKYSIPAGLPDGPALKLIACKSGSMLRQSAGGRIPMSYVSCIDPVTGINVSLPSFAVEEICQHPAFGVQLYTSCRRAEFGIEIYKECEDPTFGVQNFQLCEDVSHGVAAYKTCSVQIGPDGNTEICPEGAPVVMTVPN